MSVLGEIITLKCRNVGKNPQQNCRNTVIYDANYKQNINILFLHVKMLHFYVIVLISCIINLSFCCLCGMKFKVSTYFQFDLLFIQYCIYMFCKQVILFYTFTVNFSVTECHQEWFYSFPTGLQYIRLLMQQMQYARWCSEKVFVLFLTVVFFFYKS